MTLDHWIHDLASSRDEMFPEKKQIWIDFDFMKRRHKEFQVDIPVFVVQ